jgi:hypothetical protein
VFIGGHRLQAALPVEPAYQGTDRLDEPPPGGVEHAGENVADADLGN